MVGVQIEYGSSFQVVSPSGSPLPIGSFGSNEHRVVPHLGEILVCLVASFFAKSHHTSY
jgi:hypothetical protein